MFFAIYANSMTLQIVTLQSSTYFIKTIFLVAVYSPAVAL
jgi:hypothetical protein